MDKNEINQMKKSLISYAQTKIDDLVVKLQDEKLVELKNIKIFFHFFSKGKFIRSYLLKKILNYYQGEENQSFYSIALAIEFFHSAILIHDDVFDNDYLRRGQKTIFYRYNFLYKKNKDNQFGKSLAIILGDLGFYLSNIFLLNAVKDHKNKFLILETFFYQVIKTALGEFLDVKSSLISEDLNIRKINLINRFKTAEYTFNLPFKLGYFLAVNNPKNDQLNLLNKIGFIMGDIYQIKDDLLNLIGDSKVTGKSVASDIKENKNTVLKKLIFKNLPESDQKLIKLFFGNKNLGKNDFDTFKKILFKNKIDQKIYQFLNNKKNQVFQLIDELKIKNKDKDEIKIFVNYLINREK